MYGLPGGKPIITHIVQVLLELGLLIGSSLGPCTPRPLALADSTLLDLAHLAGQLQVTADKAKVRVVKVYAVVVRRTWMGGYTICTKDLVPEPVSGYGMVS
jgi:hypothetical protein